MFDIWFVRRYIKSYTRSLVQPLTISFPPVTQNPHFSPSFLVTVVSISSLGILAIWASCLKYKHGITVNFAGATASLTDGGGGVVSAWCGGLATGRIASRRLRTEVSQQRWVIGDCGGRSDGPR